MVREAVREQSTIWGLGTGRKTSEAKSGGGIHFELIDGGTPKCFESLGFIEPSQSPSGIHNRSQEIDIKAGTEDRMTSDMQCRAREAQEPDRLVSQSQNSERHAQAHTPF